MRLRNAVSVRIVRQATTAIPQPWRSASFFAVRAIPLGGTALGLRDPAQRDAGNKARTCPRTPKANTCKLALILFVAASSFWAARGQAPYKPVPNYFLEEAEFRALQMQDEHGHIPPDGLIKAMAHKKNMPYDPRAWGKGGRGGGSGPLVGGINSNSWVSIGPGNIGGRIRSIVINPTNTSIMYLGGVGGGVWKSYNGGSSWLPLNDFMANLAIGCMVMDPTNPNVIFAGTGEGNGNIDSLRGAGIFKTTDGGTNWIQIPSTATSGFYYVNRLAIAPNNNLVLLAGTQTGIWRSTDGGSTWSQRYSANAIFDIAFNPSDATKAVASGGYFTGVGVYSTDGGVSWSTASGLPTYGEIEVAYAASSPNIVYASANNTGSNSGQVYKSTDGGVTYTLSYTGTYLSSQGWYDNCIWVDPTNPNIVVVGGTDIWRSTDGGVTFTDIAGYVGGIHPDQHAIVPIPTYNGTTVRTVFIGNDGGIFRATDIVTASASSGWTTLNNTLGITQFYGAAGNATSGTIVGGTQDNGTPRYTPGGGPNGWTSMFGGDGGYCAADPGDPNYFYGEYVYLQIFRSANAGASASYIDSGISDAGSAANFIAPFILDPNNANTMLAGGNSLWRSTNVKAATPSWSSIKTSISSAISAIAVAPGNSDIIWVGHNNGNVYSTANGTAASPTWTQRTGLPSRMVTRFAIDPNNVNRVFVTYGGFNSDNVYVTTTGGLSWANTGAGLPIAPIHSLVIAPFNSGYLYVGSDVGVFASTDGGATWSAGNQASANAAVDELFWMGGTNLISATHGRGAFKITISLDPLVIAPNTGFVSSGPVGGPFSVTSQNFILTNNGAATFNWSLANTSSWLSASVSSGSLTPGGGASNVVMGLTGAASGLAIGNYAATVLFTNLSTGVVQNRQFTLQVQDPLQVNPASLLFSASAGCLGSLGSQNLTLTNIGSSAISWSVASTSAWFTVSPGSGALAGSSATSANVTLTAAANALAVGNYTSTLWFTNLNDGFVQTRQVNITVLGAVPNGGFETGDFSNWTSSGNFQYCSVTSGSQYVHSGSFGAEMGPATTLGYISQNLCTVPGHQYLLSFWVNGPDGQTPNEFTASWNGTTLVDMVNFTAIGWTNMQFLVTATTASTPVKFGFRDDPTYLGFDDVTLVSVSTPPSIQVQPANTTSGLGLSASFSVTASGSAPLSYQWRFNSSSIGGATSNVFTLNNLQATNAGSYSVLITNLYGSILSSNALLTVLDPFITNQPQGQFVAAGGTATFTVGAGGTLPLSYQWKENGLNLTDGLRVSGSQAATLTISNVQPSDVAGYSVLVSNINGSVLSGSASLTAPFPPTILIQPANQTALAGSLVSFSVTATGPAPLTYQWQEQGTNISDGAKFSGTATPNLFISNVQGANMANYSVIVGNAYGSTGSSNAFLSLFPLVCWGLDSVGQADIPPGISNIMAIACGGSHELVLHTDGTMAAWGAGTNNTGINPNYGQAMIPPGLSNVTAIAGGGFHTVAAKSDGTVVAWGLNTSGQTNVPAGLSNVIAVAAGSSFSLALKSDGTVTGWGLNNFGQATPPAGLTNAVAIAAGTAFSLGLASDHTVVGWGRNNAGQTSVPPDLTNAVAIAAGSAFSMALRADGTVTAWGANDSGQTNVPLGLANVAAIACGSSHAIALKRDGSLIAWGSNIAGQTNILTGLSTVIAIAAGGSDNLVLEGVGATAPGISVQPQDLTVDCGTNAAFLVSATGTSPLAYQWRKNSAPIPGATTNSYSVTPANCQSADSYTVVISNVAGAITSSVATLSVADTIAPTIFCPSNLVLNTTTGQCSAIANYSVTATDNCSVVSLVVVPPSGSVFQKGTNVVVCTATDCGGNTNTCSFTVTVLDQELPLISCPTNQTLACNSTNGAQAFFSPTATDNCDGSVPVICTPPSGSYFLVGTNLVTCVANDSSGNTNNCTFTVTVVENQPLLSISISGTNCVLVWPQSCANYVLEQRPNFDQSWSPVGGTPSPSGTDFTITIPLTNSAFFRLRQN